MLMPKVSVVIPNYNHGKFLRARLESVFGQTFQDFEVIFLDDASTDDSRAVFQQVSAPYKDRVTAIFNEINSGNPFRQWNKGALLAKGEYLWIAESDDYADQTFLARLVSVLDLYRDVGLVYCHSPFVDEFGTKQEWSLGEKWEADFIKNGKQFINDLLPRNAIPNASAVLLRRSVFEAAGLAHDSMAFCGDWFTWIKMAMISDVAFVANPLNHYRRHSGTVSSRLNRSLEFVDEHYRIIQHIKERVFIPEEVLDDVCENVMHLWLELLFAKPTRNAFRKNVAIYRRAKTIDPRPRVHLLKCSVIKVLDTLHLWPRLYDFREHVRVERPA